MARKAPASNAEHPIAFGSFLSWLKLIRISKGIDRRYIPRFLFVTLSTLLTSPLRIYERIRYSKNVRGTSIHPSPVFIVGHWRTGTTHLHNLLCRDGNFGYLSTFQAFAPGMSLVGEKLFKEPLARIARKRHPTREIDNIPLSFDAPEEEDLAVANLSPYSFLHLYTFPRQAPYFFERYALFRDLPKGTLDRWKEIYLSVMRKATLHSGGKHLLIKNCADSGRIPALLDMFPRARFIHITRNPYDVYRSTLFLYRTVLPRSQVQEIDPARVEEYILRFYALLMKKFLADKGCIPDGNLVEIRFEDLETAPMDALRTIYEGLDLPGFQEAEPAFRDYLDSVSGYRKNRYEPADEVIVSVNRHWQFAFDAWGYERLEPQGGG